MKKILNILYWILIIFLISVVVYVYKTKFFNDYLKTMKTPVSSFSRVSDMPEELKSSGYTADSYKIESEDYNNALFYKEINVKKNTPYKVSCYVKTENVESIILDEYKKIGVDYVGGANISIYGEDERSEVVYGTTPWRKLEFIFDSKDREKVEIAFRLGTDMCDSKGAVYYSNIVVEEGIPENKTNWNFGMFIFNEVKIALKDKAVYEIMNDEDRALLKQDIDNFKSSIEKMTRGKINANIITKYIDEPITNISIDEENGYYIDVYDVYELIKEELHSYDYDHIFFIFKSDDLNKDNPNKKSEVDWVGLGGMYYNSIGYSNIRLPITYEHGRHMFIYDRNRNTFPEEVFVHEFLHSLETVCKEEEISYPSIHDYSNFGYQNNTKSKLKTWYTDFLNMEITNEFTDEFYGLEEEVYSLANPANSSSFNGSNFIEFDKEPENIIDSIKLLCETISHNFGHMINVIKERNSDTNENVINNNVNNVVENVNS